MVVGFPKALNMPRLNQISGFTNLRLGSSGDTYCLNVGFADQHQVKGHYMCPDGSWVHVTMLWPDPAVFG